LEETLALKREISDLLGLPASLANLGNLLILQGKPEAAGVHIREALEIRRQMEDRQGMLSSISQVAALAVIDGQYGRAATLYAAADNLHQTMSISRTSDIESDYQRDLKLIHSQLSPVEIVERQAAGAAFTIEEAADFALASFTEPASAPAPLPPR
jgi:hypothetical protein